MKKILILGGGAAGLVAGITAAEKNPDAEVIILEKNAKIGKKLLATGNGRCNLDNENCENKYFFSSDRKQLDLMLREISKKSPLEWFKQHGLLVRSDEVGRIYPYSNQAADVLNLLMYWLEKLKVKIYCNCTVVDIAKKKNGFLVKTSEENFYADAVICAMGGKAGPQFGTDGFGFEFGEYCGCQIEKIYPCLVPLNCDKNQISGLSGIRVKGSASLIDCGKTIHTEIGEIQFTDYGISGIAVMQLSAYLGASYKLKNPEIVVDLFPHLSCDELKNLFINRSKIMSNCEINDFITGLVQHRVGISVWKTAKLGKTERLVSSLSKDEWEKLAFAFKNWHFSNLSPTDWKNAQTSGGGIKLSQLNPHSFETKHCKNLYFVGETTDCAGACGGYNLHWAFGSAILAAENI